MNQKVIDQFCKYLTNEDVLKRVVKALVEMDEEFNGEILEDRDSKTLNDFSQVF